MLQIDVQTIKPMVVPQMKIIYILLITSAVVVCISVFSLKELLKESQKTSTTTAVSKQMKDKADPIKANVALLQNQQNCSAIENDSKSTIKWEHDDHPKNTVSCPCGSLTSPNLHQKMIDHYGHLNHALLQKCLQLKLPLTKGSPKECWPRMFIAASYPTSGNQLSRYLTTTMLQTNQLINLFHSQMNNVGKAPFSTFSAFNQFRIKLTSMCVQDPVDTTHLPIPMMGKAAIWKTHWPKSFFDQKNWDFREVNFPPKNKADHSSYTHGVIHLTRNPGDHIIRDGVRWGKSCDDWNSTQCKDKLDHLCPRTAKIAVDWKNWHDFWFSKTNYSKTSHFLYAYEHFSNLKFVKKVTVKLIDFLDEPELVDGIELEKLVRQPSYVHGTVLAKYCGNDVAREVHEVTKETSEKLGYIFDYESASWSLPDP